MIRIAAMALLSTQAATGKDLSAVLYKNPSCTCCDAYADYLRSNGLQVKVVEHSNMTLIKQQYGVSKDVEGCHSTIIGDYVIEGHVPFLTIKKMLSDKPAIKGISLPGMPAGSPGMGVRSKVRSTFYRSPIPMSRTLSLLPNNVSTEQNPTLMLGYDPALWQLALSCCFLELLR